MLAGLDVLAIFAGELIMFNAAEEAVMAGGRVQRGHTRHVCEEIVTPRRFQPLLERPGPKVRCGKCELLVKPDAATYYKFESQWLCHGCRPPGRE